MLCKVILALAITAVSFVNAGGYAASCLWCQQTRNSVLDCNCFDGHGGDPETLLNLDQCFVNQGGLLSYLPNGGFSSSCRYLELGGVTNTVLAAQCRTDDGTWVQNHVDLNDFVTNDGGTLRC